MLELDDLPAELLLLIMSFLPLDLVCRLASVSRRFYRLSHVNSLWQTLRFSRQTIARGRTKAFQTLLKAKSHLWSSLQV